MKSNTYIKSHNLVNRCYDMLYYFNAFKGSKLSTKELKENIFNNLHDIETVETYAKYFDTKLKRNKKDVEVQYNLRDLIGNLNFLKQYLEKSL